MPRSCTLDAKESWAFTLSGFPGDELCSFYALAHTFQVLSQLNDCHEALFVLYWIMTGYVTAKDYMDLHHSDGALTSRAASVPDSKTNMRLILPKCYKGHIGISYMYSFEQPGGSTTAGLVDLPPRQL
ncbi:hypothetical protein llap_7365 [Limosa lapponica baueri]|uniref:Uncharacterized protein n=1 Tax=Limosa lapponica baueri TaxID=1758121 RepID=A0A2I0U8G3_LIMLA|nr:hypothetical protein llap_7365 [Limosa lapponica baueri]